LISQKMRLSIREREGNSFPVLKAGGVTMKYGKAIAVPFKTKENGGKQITFHGERKKKLRSHNLWLFEPS